MNPKEILAKHLQVEPDDLTEDKYSHYGLTLYSLGNRGYVIGTDEEVNQATKEEIKQSLWAFNADFLLSQCELPLELVDGIKALQEKKCEDCNDVFLSLIEKTCGLDKFVEKAIAADGRGHFLAQYDHEEIELENDYYAYRVN